MTSTLPCRLITRQRSHMGFTDALTFIRRGGKPRQSAARPRLCRVAKEVMSESERLSRSFYASLGADKLAARTRPEWDAQIVDALEAMLPRRSRVLDVGCGHGRIALPLADRGHSVDGLDLAPELIAEAQRRAEERGLDIRLTVGSMRSLPYAADSFSAVLCLWSSFYELLEEDEQVQALAEMWRVVAPGGFTLVEGPLPPDPIPTDRIARDVVEGLAHVQFVHDESTLRRVCERAGVPSPKVFAADWAGRLRLFLRAEKPRP
jgi:SAM-dependent methyltransferase